MKRLTDSCKLARALEHPSRQGRRTVTTFQEVGNEQQINHELANPQYKSVRASRDGNGYIRSNGMSSSLGSFAEAGGMKSRSNEKHLVYGPNVGVSNPMLHRDVSPGEPRATDAWHKAEAESPKVVTPSQQPAIPPEHSKPRPDEYNVQKVRIHANLWQQEIKKHLGGSTCVEEDADCGLRKSSVRDPRKCMPEDWESFDPSEGHYEENPAKEEAMMLEEFQKRRERNRVQIASFVKQHLYGRRRPVDGWKYILNNFGKDGKGASGSALSGEGQTAGNPLEKLALKRESGGLRWKG